MEKVYIVMIGVVGTEEKWVGSLFFDSFENAESYITIPNRFKKIAENYYEEINDTEILTASILELDKGDYAL